MYSTIFSPRINIHTGYVFAYLLHVYWLYTGIELHRLDNAGEAVNPANDQQEGSQDKSNDEDIDLPADAANTEGNLNVYVTMF